MLGLMRQRCPKSHLLTRYDRSRYFVARLGWLIWSYLILEVFCLEVILLDLVGLCNSSLFFHDSSKQTNDTTTHVTSSISGKEKMNFTSNSPNQTSSPCPLAMNLKLIRMNERNLRKPLSAAGKKQRQLFGSNFKALPNHRKMIQMYQLRTCQAILARKFPFTIYRNLCLCGDRFQ